MVTPKPTDGPEVTDSRRNAAGYLVHPADPTKVACGGTLIDPRVVATAAHCVNDGKALSFGVGNVGGPTVGVQMRVVHPNFDPHDKLRRHDVAYLILESPITNATRAALPTSAEETYESIVAIGYRKTGGAVLRKTVGARIGVRTTLHGNDPIFEVDFSFYHAGGLCMADGDEGSAAMIGD